MSKSLVARLTDALSLCRRRFGSRLTDEQREEIDALLAEAAPKQPGRPQSIDDAEIGRLKATGLSNEAIAKEIGCSKGSVFNALQRLATIGQKSPK